MKNHFFKLLLLSILTTTYFGCSSDSENCETISCQNGGTFVDCECECPLGYTGTDCSEQAQPSKILVSKATVRLFPLTDGNGEVWDSPLANPDALPDVYFQFVKSPSTILYDSPTFFENADLSQNYEFIIDTAIEVSDYTTPYIISLFDYDLAGDDDIMAAQAFFIYENDNGFPSTITVLDSGQPIAVDLEVSYQF